MALYAPYFHTLSTMVSTRVHPHTPPLSLSTYSAI